MRARERRKHASAAAGSSGDNYRGKMRHGAAHTKPPRPSVRASVRVCDASVLSDDDDNGDDDELRSPPAAAAGDKLRKGQQ